MFALNILILFSIYVLHEYCFMSYDSRVSQLQHMNAILMLFIH